MSHATEERQRGWICLLGSSELGLAAARDCGFDVGLASDGGELPAASARIPILTTPVDLGDLESVRLGVRRLVQRLGRPRAIVSFREYGCLPAAILSTEYGLPTNPPEVVEVVRDKARMRRCLEGDPSLSLPFHEGHRGSIRSSLVEALAGGSWIIKPCDRSGSEQVSFVADRRQLDAWHEAAADVAVPRWLAEPFIDGFEVSVEAVTFAGRHHCLGVTAKETAGPGFVEVGHSFPARLDPGTRQSILALTTAALTRLGVRAGGSHTEIKVDPRRGPVIIETHTRPGGDCIPELVALATGVSQYQLAIESLFRDELPAGVMERVDAPAGAASVRFLTPPRGVVTGVAVEDAQALAGAVRWRIERRLLDPIGPLDRSSARAGFVVCQGVTREESEAKARAACEAIRFTVRACGGTDVRAADR